MSYASFNHVATGSAFEVFLSVVSENLQGKTYKTIGELTEKVITGSDRSGIKISKDKFDKDILKELEKSYQNSNKK
jgi:hypothetical protein